MVSDVRSFFDLNYQLVLFAYGQVFFILGLAVALQSRQHSRLELARHLPWLALFGLTHGLHEWGLLLIPIQATYMGPVAINILIIIRILLLGISFGALFQFGVALWGGREPLLRRLPALATALWLVVTVLLAVSQQMTVGEWQQWASVLARYGLALPGSLFAAIGLRYQAARQIRPLQLHEIYETLRLAGLALLAYGFFGGIVGPYAPIFPANVLNESVLVTYLGIPAPVFRSLVGLVLLVTMVRALEVFNVEVAQLIEEMQMEQNMAAERERLGRELHDGAIQRAYTAGLLLESAQRYVEAESVAGQRLERANTALTDAIADLRTYMSGMRLEPVSVSLQEGLRKVTSDERLAALLDVSLSVDLPREPDFDPVQRAHVLAIVGEALANAARHARAGRVRVETCHRDGLFILTVTDDGRGFDVDAHPNGFGLRNMRDRARLLGGTLTVESEEGAGTIIMFSAPWEKI
ncbi:MAG: sensor histidine kinase [Anaerolineae bacterium]|nr:sensor histidine kinase [Anaerolineae bacterium]